MQLPSIQKIYPKDSNYPERLKQIKDSPRQLYARGNLAGLFEPCLTIVGSRKISSYGSALIRDFIPYFVKAGLTIVSGLAYGVDVEAHRTALKYGGKCAAVLGSGLNQVYPRSHCGFANEIIDKGGCLLSEYEPEAEVKPYHFPARNRILVGLSQVVWVVEAEEKSGSLITAKLALESGRELCVVPADIYREQSRGINLLLMQGSAQAVTSPADILMYYNQKVSINLSEILRPALTGSPASLYDLISQGEKNFDELWEITKLSVQELQSVLSVLEMDGYIIFKEAKWQRI